MPKKQRLTLRDLEQETEKFMAPSTDKERAILDAAVELIGKHGVDGATTAEIAKRAGVTEKTLFRYFPSKSDLVKRVLSPPLLRAGLSREWETFATLLKTKDASLKDWYVRFTTQRLAAISKYPALARTVLIELAQNDELRNAVAQLWQQQIWRPMTEGLDELRERGAIRREIDAEVLARAIHCLNIGYFFVRHVFAADQKWDDA